MCSIRGSSGTTTGLASPTQLDADAEAEILALRGEIAKRRAIASEAIGNAGLAGVRLSREYMELAELYVLSLIAVDEMFECGKKIWGSG